MMELTDNDLMRKYAHIYQAREAAKARAEVQSLRQEQAPLVEQIQLLQNEYAMATDRLAGLVEGSAKDNNHNMELLKLRGEVGMLRQQADDSHQKELIAEQTLAETLSYKAQFNKEEQKAVNDMKMLTLAMRIYANDNGGVFTDNVLELTNELGGYFDSTRKTSHEFDSVNVGAVKLNTNNGTIIGPDNMVQFREHVARQAPDGTWRRIYVFADGRVITANSVDGNFDAWETANTFLARQNN
jgi:hypothetical protein